MALIFQGMIMAVRASCTMRAIASKPLSNKKTPLHSSRTAYLYLSVLHYEWITGAKWEYLLEAMKIGERIWNDELL